MYTPQTHMNYLQSLLQEMDSGVDTDIITKLSLGQWWLSPKIVIMIA